MQRQQQAALLQLALIRPISCEGLSQVLQEDR